MSIPRIVSTPAQVRTKRKWYALFGINSLLISIILHTLFAVSATYLIVAHFLKPRHLNFQAAAPPQPHDAVEHKVELAKKSSVESAPPDLKRITTTDVSSIDLPEVPPVPPPDDVTPAAMSGVDGVMDSGMGGSGSGGNGGGAGGGGYGAPSTPFGSNTGQGLVGYLYDFKQTPDRKPTDMPEPLQNDASGKFDDVLRSFLDEEWDDKLFDKYYKSKNMLHLDHLAITGRQSEQAPAAFRLENEVRGGLWAIHYHGKVTAPESGEYRFVGMADNILAVRIRGRTVLDAGITFLTQQDNLHEPVTSTWVDNGNIKPVQGPIFHMDAGEATDMDILIGDDGGYCAFFLLVMKVDHTYDKAPDGTVKLPFFQVGDKSAPRFDDGENAPPHSNTPEAWQINPDADNPENLQNLGN